MASARIFQGDVVDMLKTLPNDSVHCVVTSPPYYGLRDYGTGTWSGGDLKCDHVKSEMRRGINLAASVANTRGGALKCAEVEDVMYGAECGKCGAVRVDKQIGLEKTPAEFIAKLVEVFREVRRVLRKDGTCWINMGDSYAAAAKRRTTEQSIARTGLTGGYANQAACLTQPNKITEGFKPKDLMGIPWRLAFALQDDGWWLRQDIIWSKPNPMPESVTDRCTKAHEYLFLLTKRARYYYDADAIREPQTSEDKRAGRNSSALVDKSPNPRKGLRSSDPDRFGLTRGTTNESCTHEAGRNKRSVWGIATQPFPEAHFATFPVKLVEPCILAGTSERGVCENCWTPWERVIERVPTGNTQKMADGWDTGEGGHGTVHRDGREPGEAGVPITIGKTVGWKAGCACETSTTVPSTVLDPFSGSGTTGLVALANRCNYIGIELNPEYAAMSERRLHEATAQGRLL